MSTVRAWTLWLAVALATGSASVAATGEAAERLVRAGRPAPEITGGPWINSGPLSLAQLRGRVVFVEFWTYGRYDIAPAPVEPVIHEVLDSFRHPLAQQDFKVELQVEADLPDVPMDPEAIMRQKFEDDPEHPTHIVTAHGQGYRFVG